MPSKKISKINDEFDFLLLMKIIKRYWYVILVVMSIILFGSWLYLRYTPNVYEATAIIQVENKEDNPQLFGDANIMQMPGNQLVKKIDFLRSSAFLDIALSKLPLDVLYYYNGKILSMELYKRSPFKVEVIKIEPGFYNNPIEVKFVDSQTLDLKYQLAKENKTISAKAIGGIFYVTTNQFSLKFSITDAKNIRYNDKYRIVLYHPNSFVSTYLPKINVSILNEAAKTIKITVQENDPLKAADIANTIASEFREYDKVKKQESSNNIVNYIDEQLAFIEDSLYSSENKIDNYKKEHGIEYLELKPISNIQQEIAGLENSLTKFDYDERLLSDIIKSVKNDKNLDIYQFIAQIISSEYQGSLTALLSQIQSLLLQKEQLMYDYTSNSGQIKQLNYQIEIQKKILSEVIRNFKSNIVNKKQEIRNQLDALTNDLIAKESGSNTIELKKLKRVSGINENFYNQLVEAKAKYSIMKAGYTSENLILEQSKMDLPPTSPKKGQTYLMSILAGLLICIGFIAFKYLLYNEIATISDITKFTDVPVLGMAPMYKSEMAFSQLIVDKEPKSQVAEAMRSIRSNLQFIDNSTSPKILSITSTISGEGKTFMAINLAGIIAYSGKKVIILDLDMRKPKIHKAFSEEGHVVPNKTGMSEILSNIEPYEKCINQSRVANIHFITAGTIPPNPSELILSDGMDILLEKLKQEYDFIIIDNPPIGLVTDAMKNLQRADFPIYVFRSNYSKRFFIAQLDFLWTDCKLTKLSLILNGLDFNSSYGYGSRYGSKKGFGKYSSYGYGYGYGYGYYEEEPVVESKPKNKFKSFFKS